jgi:hypothetical protein
VAELAVPACEPSRVFQNIRELPFALCEAAMLPPPAAQQIVECGAVLGHSSSNGSSS